MISLSFILAFPLIDLIDLIEVNFVDSMHENSWISLRLYKYYIQYVQKSKRKRTNKVRQ